MVEYLPSTSEYLDPIPSTEKEEEEEKRGERKDVEGGGEAVLHASPTRYL